MLIFSVQFKTLKMCILLRFHHWAVGRIMWWMPCHSASNMLKSRALRSATPPGGCSSGRKSSRPGTTLPRTAWPLTSSTSKSCAGSNSGSTVVIGWELLWTYFTMPYKSSLTCINLMYACAVLGGGPGWSVLSTVLCGLWVRSPTRPSSESYSILHTRQRNYSLQDSGEMGSNDHSNSHKGTHM